MFIDSGFKFPKNLYDGNFRECIRHMFCVESEEDVRMSKLKELWNKS